MLSPEHYSIEETGPGQFRLELTDPLVSVEINIDYSGHPASLYRVVREHFEELANAWSMMYEGQRFGSQAERRELLGAAVISLMVVLRRDTTKRPIPTPVPFQK